MRVCGFDPDGVLPGAWLIVLRTAGLKVTCRGVKVECGMATLKRSGLRRTDFAVERS